MSSASMIGVSLETKKRFTTSKNVGNFDSADRFVNYLLNKTNGDDRLQKMFQIQNDFFLKFSSEQVIDFSGEDNKQKLIKEYILALLEEGIEVLQCVPRRKLHKPDFNTIDKEKIKEELIDVQKYLFTLSLLCDINAEEFFQEFIRKSQIVEKRYKESKEGDKE